MGMELSQLRTIVNVSELGSLSKAADRLHIAQPALSRQVRMLEEELGTRLFERHGRGMVLTETGQDVLRHAYRVLSGIQEIRSCAADADASLKGHVSIGLPPTAADILTVPIVKAFKGRHPEATLRIVSAYSSYILDWLHRGDVDVAILFESTTAKSLVSDPLIEETLHLIGPRHANLSPKQPVDFSSLRTQKLLLPSSGHSLRRLLDDCTKGLGFDLNVHTEVDNFSALKNLVKAELGMTILPIAPIHEDIASGELSYAPLTKPVPSRRLMMSFPADRPATKLARFAGDVLSSTVADLQNRGIWGGKLLRGTSIY